MTEHRSSLTGQTDKEHTIARQQYERYTALRDSAGHKEYISNALKYNRYFEGDQWEAADKRALDSEGRPALTINMCLSTTNTVLGEYSKNQADIQFKPKRGDATIDTADILNKVAQHITDTTDYYDKEYDMVSDGVIQERGYLDVRMDWTKNHLGEVVVNVVNPVDVIPDPEAQSYDPKDWNEVITTKWVTLEDIAARYGQDKADALHAVVAAGQYNQYDSVEFDRGVDTFSGEAGMHELDAAPLVGNRQIKRLRVIDRQYKKLTSTNEFVDTETGEYKLVPDGWDEERQKEFAKQYGLLLRKRTQKRIRWTVTCDNVVLHDDWSPYRTLTIVPFFPYFRRGKPFGLIRNLISPQDQLNKSSSQELHIINTSANSGWMVPTGALTNMTTEELATRGAETGLVLEYNTQIGPPQKITANSVPSGIDRVSEKARFNIQDISGVSNGMRGMTSDSASGKMLNTKITQGQTQLTPVYRNVKKSRKIFGRKILELVQDYYVQERVLRIANHGEIDGQDEEVLINQIDNIGNVLNNVSLGDYDVVITERPSRDTFDDVQLAEAMAMREVGVNIPDHVVVQHSNLAKRREIAEVVKELSGLGESTPEEQQMQQVQFQMQMQTMQLSLEKMGMEIQKLSSESALNAAKAQDLAEDNEIERMKVEADIVKDESAHETRLAVESLKASLKQLDMAMKDKQTRQNNDGAR